MIFEFCLPSIIVEVDWALSIKQLTTKNPDKSEAPILKLEVGQTTDLHVLPH